MNLPFQIDLKNKVVVVTGAGGVLCSVLAKAMAMAGAKTALLDLNEDAARDSAERISKQGKTARAEKILRNTPMDRFGEAHELVGTLLYLASPEASGFVNGVVIPIDGGFAAYSGV